MNRRNALLGLGGLPIGENKVSNARAAQAAVDSKHAKHYATCSAECAACMTECEECYQHCSQLVTSGRTEHAACMQLCNDCAEISGVAARLSARRGPLVVAICEACAKACDACAAECEKFPNMAECAECAKQCRKCAKVCRDLVKRVTS